MLKSPADPGHYISQMGPFSQNVFCGLRLWNCHNDGRYLHHHNTCSVKLFQWSWKGDHKVFEMIQSLRSHVTISTPSSPQIIVFQFIWTSLTTGVVCIFLKINKRFILRNLNIFKHRTPCFLGAIALVFGLGASLTHILQLSAAPDMWYWCCHGYSWWFSQNGITIGIK